MPIEGSDELLINRSGTTYTLEQQNLMAEIQNDDLLLINRDGSTYTATGLELVDSVTEDLGLVLTFNPGVPYIDEAIECIPIPTGGLEPEGGYLYTFQWFTADDALGTINKQNLIGEVLASYTPTKAQQGKYLGCRAQTTDARGQVASAEDVSGIIDYPPVTEPPVVNSVVLTQDQVNDKRYAGNSFTTTIDVTNRQNQTLLEAQVVGALSLETSTDVITTEDPTGDAPLELVLSSDINLGDGRFEVGDEVVANSSYTPETSDIIDVKTSEISASFATSGTINISALPANETFVIIAIQDGYGGSQGGRGGGEVDGGRGGCAGKGGDAGAAYYRKFTREEYIAEFGNTYTQSKSNNFGGIVLYDEGVPTPSIPTTSRCNYGRGGSRGSDFQAEPGTLEALNEALGGILVIGAGTGGSGGAYYGETSGSWQAYYGQSGDGGDGGLTATSDVISVPAIPTASDGTKSTDSRGGEGGFGGTGWGAGGGGGGADGDNGTSNNMGSGGAGAPGINILVIGTGQTHITFEDSTDLNKLEEGDVLSSGDYLKYVGLIPENDTQYLAWDGDPNTYAESFGRDFYNPTPDGNQFSTEIVWAPKENAVPLSITKVEVFVVSMYGGDSNAGLVFSYRRADGSQTESRRTGNQGGRPTEGAWNTLYNNPDEPVTPFTLGTSSASSGATPCKIQISMFRINDEIVVDYAGTVVGKDVDNNQIAITTSSTIEADTSIRGDWSSTVVDDHPVEGNQGPGSFAFDGNFETEWIAGVGDISSWTYGGDDLTGPIRIYLRGYANSTSFGYFKVNGVEQVPSTGSPHWYTVTGVTDALTSIEITRSNGTATGTQIYAIEVNGRLLIDNGIDLGPRNFKALNPKQGEGTISTILGANVTIDPVVDNCFVNGQYLLHKNPKPIRVIPESSAISVFDLPTDTVVFESAEGLYNFAEDDVVTMVDANGDPATANLETDVVTSKTVSDSSSVLAFNSDLNFNALYATDVIKSDTEYTPDSGAISAVTQGTNTYIISDNQNPIDLTPYNSTDEIHIFVIDAGDAGGNGASGNCGNGAGGNAGRGGDGGKAYYGKKKIIDIGNTFTPNASNNFQGDQIMTDETKGKGGSNQAPGQAVNDNWYYPGEPGFEYTADLSFLNDIFKGFTFQPGIGGTYQGNGGHWWSGSGGGGAGGLDLLFDQAEYDGINNISVPVAPNAANAGAAGPGDAPGYPGGGGRGWGSGGGGGAGVKCYDGDKKGSGGTGGAGARGVTLIKIASPTVLTCATNQDFHGFEDDDEINQSDTSATGIVSGKDFTNNQLFLSSYTGTWKSDGSTSALGIARFAEGTIASKTDALKQIELTPITGAWPAGSKGTITKAGTGVVGSVDAETSSITLKSSNSQWVPGYYMKGEEKNAVEMRGYLIFDANGNNVDLTHFPQPGVLMNELENPKITFPTTFSTGEGVDTDLPYPTYLETYVTVSNNFGAAPRVKSNELFPDWTLRTLIGPANYRVMQEEFGEFCYWACSSDYRAAVKTIQNAEHTVQELRARAETMAANFLNEDDVY